MHHLFWLSNHWWKESRAELNSRSLGAVGKPENYLLSRSISKTKSIRMGKRAAEKLRKVRFVRKPRDEYHSRRWFARVCSRLNLTSTKNMSFNAPKTWLSLRRAKLFLKCKNERNIRTTHSPDDGDKKSKMKFSAMKKQLRIRISHSMTRT